MRAIRAENPNRRGDDEFLEMRKQQYGGPLGTYHLVSYISQIVTKNKSFRLNRNLTRANSMLTKL